MSAQTPITFYDIASGQPLRTFAPNPWKTRLALNFKGIPYKTEWVQMPDITAVREKLGVPANRTLPDGSPYHTLPVIQDFSSSSDKGTLIGDTFEIALYLDTAYPETKPLFKPHTTGLTAAFNAHVDGIFTKHVALCSAMPFDPAVAPTIQAIFAKRAGVSDWAKLSMSPEAREAMFVSFEAALGELLKAYRHTGGTTDYVWRQGGTDAAQRQRAGRRDEDVGPFLDGDEPSYSDFIVGAWLRMASEAMVAEDWERVRGWQGGFWGRVFDALKPWSEIK